MERTKVDSSLINTVGYDKSNRILEIEFHSGSIYQYYDVPESHFRGIINPQSKGKDFLDNIKNKFSYSRMSENGLREIDFITNLSALIEANDKFSEISYEPRIRIASDRVYIPDIACNYQGKKIIIDVKMSSPLTENRISDFILRIKNYGIISIKAQLIIIFPEEIQKKYVERFTIENIQIWDISKLASIFFHQIETIKNTPLYMKLINEIVDIKIESQSSIFVKKLESIKPGREFWSQYQKLINGILEYLFSPPLGKPHYELSDTGRINRRDIVLPNYSEGGIWHSLRNNYLAHYIVIDAKNLKGSVQKNDVLQVSNYLKEYGTGLFGIIISRGKVHSNAIHTQREHWIADKKMIIFLQDDDIIQMLRLKENSGRPEEVIRQKIEDFRLSL